MNHDTTVFLIDDDTDDQEIFHLALERADHSANCIFANDGIEALQKLNNTEVFTPDYIFIDMNMPRMNGQQCLAEIKKIDRLKDVPVYMYSTSADPAAVEENKSLGATDFIVKPANINALSGILAKIVKKQLMKVMLFIFCIGASSTRLYAQDSLPGVKELKKLSVEELMNLVVTSVSKSPEKLTDAASAIQVVTGNDIKRSTSTRLPEAMRLAPNMQIAQSGSHDWGVTARGFNGAPVSSTSLADKLLIMIDGRTVYTPLFGGVFWDVQNILLEDVDRIEVVSGPGGTLWGSNAVNGVVNVISKTAKETQGLFASAGGGTLLQDYGGVRYGSHVDSTFYFRVYGQRFDYNSTELPDGKDAGDEWNMTQGGFRMDYLPSAKNTFTLQGDVYGGEEDDTSGTLVDGQNVIARWVHAFSERSGLTVQTYADRTFRNIQWQQFKDEMTTFDIDIQHNLMIGNRNRMVWGVGYRIVDDDINTVANDFNPPQRTLQLLSGFVQDQFAIVPDRLDLTIGTKLLHNDYTEFEFQPSVRFAWTPNTKQTLWTAVSRAVRTPTRYDADYTALILSGNKDFASEKLVAYELGYRVRPVEYVSLSLATFFNQYTDLRSIDTNRTPLPLYHYANHLEAETYGVELSANVIATSWWRLRGGYTYLHRTFTVPDTLTYPGTYEFESIDPDHQVLLHSMMDIGKGFQVDVIARYVDVLAQTVFTPKVPSYITFNMRVAWQYKWLNISLSGQNLSDDTHNEFGVREIPRSFYGKITIDF